jgi:hypothetical protein
MQPSLCCSCDHCRRRVACCGRCCTGGAATVHGQEVLAMRACPLHGCPGERRGCCGSPLDAVPSAPRKRGRCIGAVSFSFSPCHQPGVRERADAGLCSAQAAIPLTLDVEIGPRCCSARPVRAGVEGRSTALAHRCNWPRDARGLVGIYGSAWRVLARRLFAFLKK